MTEGDADAMLERMARQEQDELHRAHGQHILDVTGYAKGGQERREGPLVEVLRQAHRARVEPPDDAA
jgi:hypothetical protein